MTTGQKAVRSRAVIYEEAGSPLKISDLNALSGHTRYDLPLVMGHEGVGRVEAIGEGVTMVKPGDRVVLSWAAFCGAGEDVSQYNDRY